MEAEKKDKGVVEVEENVETRGEAGAAKKEEVAAEDTMITLKSSDAKLFQVRAAAAARQSKLLAKVIEGQGGCPATGGAIPLEKIGSEALGNVVDYCNKHADSDPSAAAGGTIIFDTEASKDLEKWDRKLVGRLSHDALFDLTEAADFLNMEGLLYVTCRKVADMMKGKTAAQIRETFDIKNDFTKDEENQIRQEHDWAFFSDSKSR
ncbi:hypothetical protein BS78_02G357300 [Paspalum vaginatum]|nr:hypothetical protein BS78_02G357300 [Paspalum vaginatum]